MDMDNDYPHIERSLSNFLFDEEGNIPRNKILLIGPLVIVLSMLLSESIFAKHRTHSTHRTHNSHRSNGHTTHYTHTTHSTHVTHSTSHGTHTTHSTHGTHSTHSNHSNHATHNTHSTHSSHANASPSITYTDPSINDTYIDSIGSNDSSVVRGLDLSANPVVDDLERILNALNNIDVKDLPPFIE